MSVLSPTPSHKSRDLVPHAWIETFESELRRLTACRGELPTPLADAIGHSLLAPCKRLRPMLVLLAADACGGDLHRAMPVACAIEMVHTYSLIHDDLPAMDDDDMRRGRPSCHAVFGEANAILAGDALLTLAFEVLACEVRPAEIAVACISELARSAGGAGMVGGQVDDLRLEGTVGTTEKLESIHRRKTAALLAASVTMGGLIANAPPTVLSALASFGRNLGLAFQITDDLLDVTSCDTDLGKRAGKDASRGKLTYPGLIGLEASREKAERLIAEACREITILESRAEKLFQLAQFVLSRAN
jgi:geranylgeranyl diphosphate synthase, type II